MTKSIRNDNRGLTLVELIIGVVIFAIVITPLLHALIVGANTSKKNKLYNDATVAAQNIVEELEADEMLSYLNGLAPEVMGDNAGSYVIKQSVESGGTNFDARVIITPAKGTIPIARQMTTQFALQNCNESVCSQFIQEGGTSETITRSIAMDVAPDGADSCRVTVTVSYTATIHYLDADENDRTKPFDKTFTQSKAVAVAANTHFPVYLFFSDPSSEEYTDGDGRTQRITYNPNSVESKNIVVKNESKHDFSLFLVDVSETSQQHEVYYYHVKNDSGEMKLQTNIANLKYKAFRAGDQNWMHSVSLTPGLMETDDIYRDFTVSIEIYRAGERDSEAQDFEPLFTLNTEKLDYSTQYSVN